MKGFLLILLMCFVGGCNKTEPPIDIDLPFELIWSTRLDFNRTIGNHNNGIVYNNEYIFFGDIDSSATIYAFDIQSGSKKWHFRDDSPDESDIEYNYFLDGTILCITGSRVFGFNVKEKKIIWQQNLKEENLLRSSGNVASNKKFYMRASKNFDPLGGFDDYLLEFDPISGERRDLVIYSPDEVGTKTVSPPAYYENDIIIYNLYPNAEKPPEISIQDLVAYDMSTNTEIWRSEVTDSFASNSLHPPVIYNDIVITGSNWSIYGFDINSGEQLWRFQLPGYDFGGQFWTTTNHLLVGDRLYINPLSEEVTCLNPQTGGLIWNNPKGGANCTDNMIYYEKEDLLVFTSWGYGSVMILDALTGETIHREQRYDDSSYNNDVVYDEERDMFFTSTYKHAVGFKVSRGN